MVDFLSRDEVSSLGETNFEKYRMGFIFDFNRRIEEEFMNGTITVDMHPDVAVRSRIFAELRDHGWSWDFDSKSSNIAVLYLRPKQ
jgi:hypothetical protein